MSATGNLALALLLPAVAFAQQPTLDDIPPIDRQREHFYGALDATGKGVTAEWSAPKTVSRDGEFTLTLTVRGAANPHELARPDLRTLDEFAQRFRLLDKPDHADPPADRAAKDVQFLYRLAPRTAGDVDVPRMIYVYYRPKAVEGDRFHTARANSIRITVTEPERKVVAVTPIDAPPEFFTLAENEATWAPGLFAWVLPVLAVPPLVVAWVLLWRGFFPDAARLAKLRRNRATRTALDCLKKAHTAADPAGVAAVAFRGYVTARFGVPPAAQTPVEVAAALRDAGQPADRVADAEAFLRACDAERFDQSSDTGLSLVKAAESLVLTWEGASA